MPPLGSWAVFKCKSLTERTISVPRGKFRNLFVSSKLEFSCRVEKQSFHGLLWIVAKGVLTVNLRLQADKRASRSDRPMGIFLKGGPWVNERRQEGEIASVPDFFSDVIRCLCSDHQTKEENLRSWTALKEIWKNFS